MGKIVKIMALDPLYHDRIWEAPRAHLPDTYLSERYQICLAGVTDQRVCLHSAPIKANTY